MATKSRLRVGPFVRVTEAEGIDNFECYALDPKDFSIFQRQIGGSRLHGFGRSRPGFSVCSNFQTIPKNKLACDRLTDMSQELKGD